MATITIAAPPPTNGQTVWNQCCCIVDPCAG
jgi:hypothetical protein